MTAQAHAEPACPDDKAVRRALDAEGVDAAVVVRVRDVDDDSLRLQATRTGEVIVDRVLPASRDCEALAEAMALIISARLVAFEPASEPAEKPPATVVSPPAPASSSSSSTERAGLDAERPGETGAAVGGQKLRESGETQMAQRRRSAASRNPPAVSMAVLGSFALAVDSEASSPTGDVELAFANRRGRGLRFSLGRDAGAALRDATRTAWTARAELTHAVYRARGWARLGGGAQLVFSRVQNDSTMEATVRGHPALTASATAGLYVASRVSLRVDLGAALFPVVDRYFIDGTEVSRSPRALLAIGLGAQIDTQW